MLDKDLRLAVGWRRLLLVLGVVFVVLLEASILVLVLIWW